MGVLSLNLVGPCGCEIAKLFVSNFVSVFISQDSMTFIEFSLAIFLESPAGDMPAMCPARRIRGITFYFIFLYFASKHTQLCFLVLKKWKTLAENRVFTKPITDQSIGRQSMSNSQPILPKPYYFQTPPPFPDLAIQSAAGRKLEPACATLIAHWHIIINIHTALHKIAHMRLVDCTCTGSLLQWFLQLTYDTEDPIHPHVDDCRVAKQWWCLPRKGWW